jgi:hypothetical protein
VLAVALGLMKVAMLFQVFDGVQSVAAGALRGAGRRALPLLGERRRALGRRRAARARALFPLRHGRGGPLVGPLRGPRRDLGPARAKVRGRVPRAHRAGVRGAARVSRNARAASLRHESSSPLGRPWHRVPPASGARSSRRWGLVYRENWPARLWALVPGACRVETRVVRAALLPPGSAPMRIGFVSDSAPRAHDAHAAPRSGLRRALSGAPRRAPPRRRLRLPRRHARKKPTRCKGSCPVCPARQKVAVLGNHDLWTDHGLVEGGALSAAGVTVLVNDGAWLGSDGLVGVVGLDDPWTRRARRRACLSHHARHGARGARGAVPLPRRPPPRRTRPTPSSRPTSRASTCAGTRTGGR